MDDIISFFNSSKSLEIPLYFNASIYGGTWQAVRADWPTYKTKVYGTSYLNTEKHKLKLDEENLTIDGTLYNTKDFLPITNIFCKNGEIFLNNKDTNIFDFIKEKKLEGKQ